MNGNKIFNIIISLAVLVLYILHFTSSSVDSSINLINTSDSSAQVVDQNAMAVYVNGDSLLENYDYFKKAKKDFEAKTLRTENEIAAKRTNLEKEFANYQQTGGSMTTEQRARVEESLMRKEQELRTYADNAASKLQEEQNKFNEQLFDKVAAYLKEHTKGKKYKVVFNFTKGSGILYINDSLNITSEVLKGLNEEFNKN